MAIPQSWKGEAYNQVPDSDNPIHGDEVARAFGFRGGLVPGVTVSAYLVHPAVEAWSEDWLARGRARVVVSKPLYDRQRFRVELSDATEHSYEATLIDAEGTHCATASVGLPEAVAKPPAMRGDPRLAQGDERPPATREVMEGLRESGLRAMRARWNGIAEMTSYLRDPSQMPELLRPEGGGYANTAFALGLTNWVLSSNVRMGPWLHLQTESQHYQPIPRNTELVIEAAIADLFEKKGHEFADLEVVTYRLETREAFLSARLRAIYRMRGS